MGSGQQTTNASFTPAYPLVSQVSNLEQTPLHTSSTLHNNNNNINLSNAISVRVRGPGNLPMHAQGAPSSDNSSLGWFHNEEEEDNEEKLKQELKKAKVTFSLFILFLSFSYILLLYFNRKSKNKKRNCNNG